ncbi:MAG TPA: hypothetical protein VMB05_07510 [Solirubrobacteraceae bacterium]|nr:hypothetical protein [Solirubrobacteraceae bacterium]
MVLAVEALRGFDAVVRPVLDAVDAARLAPKEGEKKRRGRAPSFHARDYWRLEMLRRVLASHSTQHTRDWLTTDKAAKTRELLGFDAPRAHYGGKERRWREGVPSDGWMSDFRVRWLPEVELARLMSELEKWALAEKMTSLPWMREECGVLYADGSKLETHATAPKLKTNKKTGESVVVNQWKKGRDGSRVKAITAPEAGYVSNSRGNNADHSGHGWNIVMVTSSKGTVLAHRNVPLNASESGTLCEMAPEVGQVLDVLGERDLRVLTTDAAFHARETRRAWREVGVLENTHLSSHGGHPTSKRKAAERDKKRYPIEGHPGWFANGHREIKCRCGKGRVSRVVGLDSRGRAYARAKGECETCKSRTLITSGMWRLSSDEKFVKCTMAWKDKADLALGNPLTFNDSLAAEYGRRRFNGQEGAFGSQFTQRFKLLKSKRWFYRQSQVDLEVAAVVTITHALSLERWRRMGEPRESVADAEPLTELAA